MIFHLRRAPLDGRARHAYRGKAHHLPRLDSGPARTLRVPSSRTRTRGPPPHRQSVHFYALAIERRPSAIPSPVAEPARCRLSGLRWRPPGRCSAGPDRGQPFSPGQGTQGDGPHYRNAAYKIPTAAASLTIRRRLLLQSGMCKGSANQSPSATSERGDPAAVAGLAHPRPLVRSRPTCTSAATATLLVIPAGGGTPTQMVRDLNGGIAGSPVVAGTGKRPRLHRQREPRSRFQDVLSASDRRRVDLSQQRRLPTRPWSGRDDGEPLLSPGLSRGTPRPPHSIWHADPG